MTTKNTKPTCIALLEAKLARAKADERHNIYGGSSKWAQCWNHSANG
jgi:hypothetical protein